MKLDKFLTSILPAETFKNNDLAAVLGASSLKEIDMPDEVATQFSSVYLTKDRALNDPDLVREYKGKAWANFADTVEDDLKNKIVGKLPEDFKKKYFEAPKVYDKLSVLADAFSHISEKGAGEDVKTLAEKHRKQEAELRQQITDRDNLLKKTQEDFAAKETGIKIDYALRSKLMDRLPKLDPNLIKTDKQKAFIIDSTIHSLRSNYLLEFDKENQQSINFLKKDRSDVYEGNTKVTLDDFISRELEPYTVKNNGGDTPKPDPKPVAPTNNPKGWTLEDYRRQQAGVTA